MDLAAFDHPTWYTAVGTALGYALVLVVMTVLLFLVPYCLFKLL